MGSFKRAEKAPALQYFTIVKTVVKTRRLFVGAIRDETFQDFNPGPQHIGEVARPTELIARLLIKSCGVTLIVKDALFIFNWRANPSGVC